jgi:GntR family transcriptional regulator
MCLEDAYLADAIVPGFLDSPLPSSLYAELQRRDLLPSWGEDSVDAEQARHDEGELLGVPEGSPVLKIARRAFADNVAVEVSRSTYRADRYTLWVPLSRPNPPVTRRNR